MVIFGCFFLVIQWKCLWIRWFYGDFFFCDFMVIEFYFLMEKYVMTIIYGDIGIGVRWNIPPHFKEPFYGDIMGIYII